MLFILLLISLLLTSCTAPSEVPTWFDSIQRLPVRTVQVQGHRIAYLDVGQGPPVILVHGIGGSMWQWEYQQTALSA
ncbi:MAG: alpha/beta fold hydrolase, partial [Candidatus Methylomirabilales bacterium]